MSEEKTKMKPRGGNSPVIGDNGIQAEPGDNSKYAKLAYDIVSWGKVDRRDISALENRFGQYVAFCIENDIKPGNLACYAALGITKQIASDWENGVYGSSAHKDFIKKVKLFCGMNREFLMQDGKVNYITGIFWQKNYDGLKDVQDVVLTPNNPLGDIVDPEELKRRYMSAVPELEE